MRHPFKTLFPMLVLLLCATPGAASWMGEVFMWIRVDSVQGTVQTNTRGQYLRTISFTALHWGYSQGHGDAYYQDCAGKTFTKTLVFPDRKQAEQVRAGQENWVKHHAATWFSRDKTSKLHRARSSSSWTWMGTLVTRANKPERITADKDIPDSAPLTFEWALRQQDILTIRVRYKAWFRYRHTFRLLWKDAANNVSPAGISLHLVHQDEGDQSQKRTTYRLLQYRLPFASATTIRLFHKGKLLATIPAG